jgi:hypothetical protein
MTYVDEVEVRRASVGTKVLAFACGIFAVLGSFWAIVWFIRTYVEAPRVNIPAPMALAASESRPAPAPESRVIPKAEAAEAPPAARSSKRRQNPRPRSCRHRCEEFRDTARAGTYRLRRRRRPLVPDESAPGSGLPAGSAGADRSGRATARRAGNRGHRRRGRHRAPDRGSRRRIGPGESPAARRCRDPSRP